MKGAKCRRVEKEQPELRSDFGRIYLHLPISPAQVGGFGANMVSKCSSLALAKSPASPKHPEDELN